MSNWCATPTILWRWRNRWDRKPSSSSNRGWKESSSWRSTGRRREWWILREEAASLTFLGYTYRYDHDLKGRARKYLNVFPSRKAVQREKEKLHEMTDCHQCFKPIPVLIGELTRHL